MVITDLNLCKEKNLFKIQYVAAMVPILKIFKKYLYFLVRKFIFRNLAIIIGTCYFRQI